MRRIARSSSVTAAGVRSHVQASASAKSDRRHAPRPVNEASCIFRKYTGLEMSPVYSATNGTVKASEARPAPPKSSQCESAQRNPHNESFIMPAKVNGHERYSGAVLRKG